MAVPRIYWERATTETTSTILEKLYINKTKRKEAETQTKKPTKRPRSQIPKEFQAADTKPQHLHQGELEAG